MVQKQKMAAIAAMVLALLASGCGRQPEGQESISIIAAPTKVPTAVPTPGEISYPKDASVEKDGVTIVNQYLIDHPDQNPEKDS